MKKAREEALTEFLNSLHITMQDLSLMDTALTHSSYAYEVKAEKRPEFNQRLEFLGDSVLSLVVSTYLYKQHPEMDEGRLSKFRAFLVCEETLAELAADMHLGQYLLLGKGEQHLDGEKNPSILADAFESVIGAYYLDEGYEKASQLLYELLIRRIPELTDGGISRDYKTKFQELVQKDGPVDIEYKLSAMEGPPHNRTFIMKVLVNGKECGTGKGRTKKAAEQYAARVAFKNFSK
ncbi:MAG: ribonuclease III [Acidaminococcus sp.]|jgi:ribonuclease-3|nr:ribonuclease III [Acidaminococcus sp.]MCI2101026.1 ribonuclease III [Acidaminococcus sp.]MCI2115420.1 ribonuclease III [Acidaminococcus sp.]MCI2117527.1 ribonuclease III [Acidaminococcus sp.]